MKVLILGAKGILGGQLAEVFGNEAVGWDRNDADVTKTGDLRFKIKNLSPDVIINCAAYNDVDGAEDNRELAFKLNAEVPENLAEICKELRIKFVHFSTNYVFDGKKGEYSEADLPNPYTVYAKSKYEGELAIQKIGGKIYLIRTAVLFGPKGKSDLSKKSFVEVMLDKSKETDTIKLVTDEVNSITYALDLAKSVKSILTDNLPYGIYHITNSGSASWCDFAGEIFRISGKKIKIIPILANEFSSGARRPKKSVLLNTKLPPLRSWQEALKEFLTFK